MKSKTIVIIVCAVILVALAVSLACLPKFTVLSDAYYADTSLAQVRGELFWNLLKRGMRLHVVALDRLPEDGVLEARNLRPLLKRSRYVLSSPLVSACLKGSADEKPLFIAMGREGEGNPLFSVVLEADDEDGYEEARKAGKIQLFLYQGERPEVEKLYVRSERVRDESSVALQSRFDAWKADNVDTIVAFKVRCLPAFFENGATVPFRFVIPSLYLLSIPQENIEGLVIDDLSASLGALSSLEKGRPQLNLPLVRSYRSGTKMRGGSLRMSLQSLLRFFR